MKWRNCHRKVLWSERNHSEKCPEHLLWIKNREEGDGKDLDMKNPWGVDIWSLTSLNVSFVPGGEASKRSRDFLEKSTCNI